MKDEKRNFRVSNSGWQTRTYERPYPYNLEYPENISYIKTPFLEILDFTNKNRQLAHILIAYFFRLEIKFLEAKGEMVKLMAKDSFGNEILIADIIDSLNAHFETEQSSHLPVIAIYTIYQLITDEVDSYSDLSLKKMDHHNSADKRTGAIGDIEISQDDIVVEAIEVKHNIKIDVRILIDAQEKILNSNVKRYYILTTHTDCEASDVKIKNIISKTYKDHGCQIIVNGVIRTISYYLRMCKSPVDFLRLYSNNLANSDVVTIEQLNEWNKIKNRLSD